MGFSSVEDVRAIEQETPWSERDLPATVYDMLDKIASKMPDANAAPPLCSHRRRVNSAIEARP